MANSELLKATCTQPCWCWPSERALLGEKQLSIYSPLFAPLAGAPFGIAGWTAGMGHPKLDCKYSPKRARVSLGSRVSVMFSSGVHVWGELGARKPREKSGATWWNWTLKPWDGQQ